MIHCGTILMDNMKSIGQVVTLCNLSYQPFYFIVLVCCTLSLVSVVRCTTFINLTSQILLQNWCKCPEEDLIFLWIYFFSIILQDVYYFWSIFVWMHCQHHQVKLKLYLNNLILYLVNACCYPVPVRYYFIENGKNSFPTAKGHQKEETRKVKIA